MSISNKKIGLKIKALRAKKDMTQDELAKKGDIPYLTLTKMKSGAVQNLSIETGLKISNGLGVTLDALIK
jgi:transcriptional regulator with XRE-family HTH domain